MNDLKPRNFSTLLFSVTLRDSALQLLGKLLTYDILKNRWCENIGRPHKSNHIM